MKKTYNYILLVCLLVISGCGQGLENTGEKNPNVVLPIEVVLNVPEEAKVGEEIIISSAVSQGEDLIEDASEVIFEIWEEGRQDKGMMIEPSEQEGHLYKLTHIFEKEGKHHIKVHVTARDMHRMPATEINIGADGVEQEMNHEKESNHTHIGHHSNFEVTTKIENENLRVVIERENVLFTKGKVTLELIKNGDEHTIWLDAIETEAGVYEVAEIANLQGIFQVVIHIEQEMIHDHIETEITF
ncbi:FixH family protein [Bacillus solitudinis]|uniref:FixH family protein n=1 Tax=Bacillus solitudinis TaxID=2014074 RepID=UPI000C2399B4|nr:FixH family protein [Bacillus solitudinis]